MGFTPGKLRAKFMALLHTRGAKAVLVAAVLAAALAAGDRSRVFFHDIETKQKPWTHTRFYNNPDEFQFAIVSDRTGAARRGVFPAALEKLNLLRPEFVISVGDLIEGYVKTSGEVLAQWEEFDKETSILDAPFFAVPGNHDLKSTGDADMAGLWKQRYGKLYYSFVYKNVLFMCLNAQEWISDKVVKRRFGVGLKPKQVQWAKQVLKDHPDVRWTCIFLHQNVWREKDSGWEEIEGAMGARNYTVFYGHWHSYLKTVRNGQKHFSLATTGGGSPLRGPEIGTFDHVVWVTMTDKGPHIANLALDGIMDENIVTEEKSAVRRDTAYVNNLVKFSLDEGRSCEDKFIFTLTATNRFKQALDYALEWNNPDSNWEVLPRKAKGALDPGKENVIEFQATSVAVDRGFPVCAVRISIDGKVVSAPLAIEDLLRRQLLSRPVARAGYFKRSPVIVGKLYEGVWRKAGKIESFEKVFGGKTDVKTTAFVGYDKDNLYIAFLCNEPVMAGFRAKATHRGYIHKEDFVELAVDVNRDRKTYIYLRSNALGTVDGGRRLKDLKRRGTVKPSVKAAIGDNAWTIEFAIPWENVAAAPPVGGVVMGLFLGRKRLQSGQMQHYPPLSQRVHRPSDHDAAMFADLKFEPAR